LTEREKSLDNKGNRTQDRFEAKMEIPEQTEPHAPFPKLPGKDTLEQVITHRRSTVR
jgi:hypothetical protein